jgi:hypothetical protein
LRLATDEKKRTEDYGLRKGWNFGTIEYWNNGRMEGGRDETIE